jgi:hypothetical protein
MGDKNRLFVIGDSYARWSFPRGKHWTDLMEEHYNVMNYGYAGASFTDTCLQTTYIKDFRRGDRLVVVLTYAGRISKLVRGLIKGAGLELENEVKTMMLRREAEYGEIVKSELKKSILTSNGEINIHNSQLLDFYFLLNLKDRYKDYKPIYVTWNRFTDEVVRVFINDLLYIPSTSYTTLGQEGIVTNDIDDSHPGIEGNKVWYNKIRSKLLDLN